MPRQARPHTPGNPQHVISRFVNREWRLIGPNERAAYLTRVARVGPSTDVMPCGYALMSSHVHWALCAWDDPLSAFVHPLNTGFGLWWNRTNGGFGPVFAERPKSIVVNVEEQLALLIAYIHNNPVRAGVVSNPLESCWTSHRAYVGEESAPPWLRVEWTLAAMGYSSSPSGRLAFHAFVCDRAGWPRDPTLAGPGPVASTFTEHLLRAVGDEMGLRSTEVQRPGTDERAMIARRLVITTAKEVFGVTAARVSADLGLSSGTMSRILRASGDRPTPRRMRQVVERYLEIAAESRDVR